MPGSLSRTIQSPGIFNKDKVCVIITNSAFVTQSQRRSPVFRSSVAVRSAKIIPFMILFTDQPQWSKDGGVRGNGIQIDAKEDLKSSKGSCRKHVNAEIEKRSSMGSRNPIHSNLLISYLGKAKVEGVVLGDWKQFIDSIEIPATYKTDKCR
jgi:hypothetical protein